MNGLRMKEAVSRPTPMNSWVEHHRRIELLGKVFMNWV
jgi:hypothetical protein